MTLELKFTVEHSSIANQILQFVDWFGCVEKELLIRFFKDLDSPDVLTALIEHMLHIRALYPFDTRVGVVDKLLHSEAYYDATNEALHVMCDNFTSTEIDSYMPGIDVVRLKFHTAYGDSYDVVSFTNGTSAPSIVTRALQARKMDLIPDTQDIYQHIAVIPDLSLGNTLAEFNFSLFAVINSDDTAQMYSVAKK